MYIIRTMSTCSICRGTKRVTFQSTKKPFELIALLAIAGGVELTREQIIAALWPQERGPYVCNRLSATLYICRKILNQNGFDSDELIQATRGSVRLVPGRFCLDIDPIKSMGRLSFPEDMALARRVVDHFDPPVLPGLEAPWIRDLRRQLMEQFTRAYEFLCDHGEDPGSMNTGRIRLFSNFEASFSNFRFGSPVACCVVGSAPSSMQHRQSHLISHPKLLVSSDFNAVYCNAVIYSRSPQAKVLVHYGVNEGSKTRDSLLKAFETLSLGLHLTNAAAQVMGSGADTIGSGVVRFRANKGAVGIHQLL